MKFNKNGQGTMEYLIIIAIVILISLFVVTLALNQTDNAQKINDSSDKITNTVGKGGISIVDSVTSSNGDSVISLKNTSGKTLTIKSITPIDAQGNEGTSNNYDEELITGYTSEFLAENMDEICPCVENEKTTCVIKIVFDVEEGIAGHEETFTLTNICTDEITIPEEDDIVRASESCWSDTIDPHPLCDCFDLNQVRTQLTWDYELQNDINMNTAQCAVFREDEGFIPITEYYRGTFDGAGNNIIGLYINKPTEDYVGLFSELGFVSRGDIYPAEIKSLGIIDAEIIGNSYVGGISGSTLPNCSFDEIYVSGTILGNGDSVGGIVGSLHKEYTSTVKNSYVEADISGANNVGGIIGIIPDGYGVQFIIQNLYSVVTVQGLENVGGLIGKVGYDDGIEPPEVYNNTIKNAFSVSTLSGNTNVGGLIGSLESGEVSNSGWYNINESEYSAIGNPEGDVTYTLTSSDYTDLYNSTFELYTSGTPWDFDNTWTEQSSSYPTLNWQN